MLEREPRRKPAEVIAETTAIAVLTEIVNRLPKGAEADTGEVRRAVEEARQRRTPTDRQLTDNMQSWCSELYKTLGTEAAEIAALNVIAHRPDLQEAIRSKDVHSAIALITAALMEAGKG